MIKKKHELMAYRWEFMRRNPDYRKDYNKVVKLRKKVGKRCCLNAGVNLELYQKTPEFIMETEICQKWDVNVMLDPDENLVEIIKPTESSKSKKIDSAGKVNNLAIKIWKSQYIDLVFNKAALEYRGIFENRDDMVEVTSVSSDEYTWTKSTTQSGYRYFKIEADFEKVRSLSDLKSEVCALLEKHYKNYKKKAGKKLYKTNFKTILMVGDMKLEGFTNQQIAKRIYPKLFDSNLKNSNLESTIRNISHIYKRYKDLVAGGFKNITYP